MLGGLRAEVGGAEGVGFCSALRAGAVGCVPRPGAAWLGQLGLASGNISYDSYDDFDSPTEFLALRGTEMVEILDQFGDGESLYYEKISPLLNELDEIREKDGFLVGLNFAVIKMIENEYQERVK